MTKFGSLAVFGLLSVLVHFGECIICYDCRPNPSSDVDCTKVAQSTILDCPRANFCYEKFYRNNQPYVERRGCLYGDERGVARRSGCFVERVDVGGGSVRNNRNNNNTQLVELCVCAEDGCNRADGGKRRDDLTDGGGAARVAVGLLLASVMASVLHL